MPNRAVSAATTRSHDSTISNPPASAGPFTAAMSGFGKSRCHDARRSRPCRARCRRAALRDDLEVGAGREHLAGTGQHDRAQLVVGLDLVEDRRHRLADLGTDRVARFGPVEREERGRAPAFRSPRLPCGGTYSATAAAQRAATSSTIGRGARRAAVDSPVGRGAPRAARAAISTAAPTVVARSPMRSAIFPWTTAPSG